MVSQCTETTPSCLGWEKGCVLEALDEGTCEEGSKEEDDREEEYVWYIFARVGEDTHEPEQKYEHEGKT